MIKILFICHGIKLAVEYDMHSGDAVIFLWPAVIVFVGITVRYACMKCLV